MDYQTSLFEAPSSGVRTFAGIERRTLSEGAWIDVVRSWVPAADDVFATLVSTVPWRAERRQMYDRLIDVPRLIHTYMIGEELPHPVLTEARDALTEHYLPELGEPFRTAGCCYYRNGRDSVAWHGDTIGRGGAHDTMVAIVSLGDPRKLHLRPKRAAASASDPTADSEHAAALRERQQGSPKRAAASASDPTADSEHAAALRGRLQERERGGGESFSIEMGHGDLVVMGGTCQRTWEHAIPKVARAGPRISVQFRPFNVF